MVDLWAISARMCMQYFVALRCILRKPYGFLDPGELIPTTRRRTTRMSFWDPPSCPKILPDKLILAKCK